MSAWPSTDYSWDGLAVSAWPSTIDNRDYFNLNSTECAAMLALQYIAHMSSFQSR